MNGKKSSGDVAQLVRALPCHGRGRGFEPRRPRHKPIGIKGLWTQTETIENPRVLKGADLQHLLFLGAASATVLTSESLQPPHFGFTYRSNLLTLAIAVTRSCVRNRFGEVKTEASGKPVPLHDSVREALIEWPSEFLQSRY